ncbi:MAG: hypothetical protein ACAH59_03880 [Pseudobdellovibrionaceae bacterium]
MNESDFQLIPRYLSKPYYFYLLEKLKQSGVLTEEANLRINECLKMLLVILNSKGTAPISKAIDDVWHLMILETREYEKFCLSLPEARFIHHRSVVFERIEKGPATKESFSNSLKEKLSWFVSYYKNFGAFKEAVLDFWPLTKEIMKDKKLTLDEFNALLKSAAFDHSVRRTLAPKEDNLSSSFS